MNEMTATWHDAVIMLTGFACLAAFFGILLFFRRK
jgi:hypothetical protein